MEIEGIEFNHQAEIQIRFNDIDALGHVNNAVQSGYFDLGRMRYFEKLTGGPIQWKKFTMVIASVHTEYKAPILLHDQIWVKTKVVKLGEKSLTMVQALVNEKGEVQSTSNSIMVAIDIKTGKSAPIQDEIRTMVEKFESL